MSSGISSGAVGWNTYTWPLLVTWASSQCGSWVLSSWVLDGGVVGRSQFAFHESSEIMWHHFHHILFVKMVTKSYPSSRGERNRLYLLMEKWPGSGTVCEIINIDEATFKMQSTSFSLLDAFTADLFRAAMVSGSLSSLWLPHLYPEASWCSSHTAISEPILGMGNIFKVPFHHAGNAVGLQASWAIAALWLWHHVECEASLYSLQPPLMLQGWALAFGTHSSWQRRRSNSYESRLLIRTFIVNCIHPFILHPVGQNFVTWPHLTGKCRLYSGKTCVQWKIVSYLSKEKIIDF